MISSYFKHSRNLDLYTEINIPLMIHKWHFLITLLTMIEATQKYIIDAEI